MESENAVAEPCASGYGSTAGRSDWGRVLKQVSSDISTRTCVTQMQPDEEDLHSLASQQLGVVVVSGSPF